MVVTLQHGLELIELDGPIFVEVVLQKLLLPDFWGVLVLDFVQELQIAVDGAIDHVKRVLVHRVASGVHVK